MVATRAKIVRSGFSYAGFDWGNPVAMRQARFCGLPFGTSVHANPSSHPIPRSTALVSDGCHPNSVTQDREIDRVREPMQHPDSDRTRFQGLQFRVPTHANQSGIQLHSEVVP